MFYLTIVTKDGHTQRINKVTKYGIESSIGCFYYVKGNCIGYHPIVNTMSFMVIEEMVNYDVGGDIQRNFEEQIKQFKNRMEG